MEPGLVLVLMLVGGGVSAAIAAGKDRSTVGFFVVGTLMPLLGIILALVVERHESEAERRTRLRATAAPPPGATSPIPALSVVVSLLVGCSAPGATTPPTISNAVPAVRTPAAPRVVACISTRDCIVACGLAEPMACVRAYDSVFTGLDYDSEDDPYKEAAVYARRGCDLGEAAACTKFAQSLRLDQPEQVRQWALAACEGGASDGCHLLIDLAQSATERQRLIDRTRAGYELECADGSGHACMALAGMYGAYAGFFMQGPPELGTSDEKIKEYLTAAIESFENACNSGDPLACLGRIWVYQQPQLGVQEPHPRHWADRACELVGAPGGCWGGDQPTLFGYEDASRL